MVVRCWTNVLAEMTEGQLARQLSRRLGEDLPAAAAHAAFAPELSYGRHQIPPLATARQAAVLILLYRADRGWQVALTRRPDSLARHAGQISFPGGAVDAAETIEEAALRELQEELGVGREGLRMLGRLSPVYVFGSNFHVTPCLAMARQRPHFRLNRAEVANLLEPAIVDLLDPQNLGRHRIWRGAISFETPHFAIAGERVWGATSMILAEFLSVLGSALRSTDTPG